jgi:hypothetical protein
MNDATEKASAADARSVQYWKERVRVDVDTTRSDLQAKSAAEQQTAAEPPAPRARPAMPRL